MWKMWTFFRVTRSRFTRATNNGYCPRGPHGRIQRVGLLRAISVFTSSTRVFAKSSYIAWGVGTILILTFACGCLVSSSGGTLHHLNNSSALAYENIYF